MSEPHEDSRMGAVMWLVRSMYFFALGYFTHGFWNAREVFYSPPFSLLVAAWIGLLCAVALLGVFCVTLFAKRPLEVLAKIFFLRKRERMGGNGQ